MEEEPAEEPRAANIGACPYVDLGEHIAALLGVRSPLARQHLRNARIEMLKALRAMIDERIEHLSQAGTRGTKIGVD